MEKKDIRFKGGLLGEYILYGVFVGISIFLLLKYFGKWNVLEESQGTVIGIAFVVSMVSGIIIAGLFSFMLSKRSIRNNTIGIVIEIVKMMQKKGAMSLEYKQESMRDNKTARNTLFTFINNMLDRITELTKSKKEYEDTVARLTDMKVHSALHMNNTKGEVKDVSVLFTDVKNFGEFYQNMSTEDVIRFLNTYLTTATNIVHNNNGIVNKFIGDEMMAVFESKPGDDKENGHEVRALNAALEIARNYDGILADSKIVMPTPLKLTFGIGIGIHSGPSIVGTIGSKERMEFTVLGDTVEIASRIAMVAGVGVTLITADTYQRIGKRAEVMEPEPVNIGGREGLYKVYIVKALNLIMR